MECIIDYVPTSSLWYEKKTGSLSGNQTTLRKNGVVLYDIIGKRNYVDKSFLPRFFFLLPGRLAYSRNLTNADDALADAMGDADRNTRSLDITPYVKIEWVNAKTFRIWNPSFISIAPSSSTPAAPAGGASTSGSRKAADLVMSGAGESSQPSMTPAQTPAVRFNTNSERSVQTSSLGVDSLEHDRVLAPLNAVEEKQSLLLLFPTPELAKSWEQALLAEQEKVYMPQIAALPSYARQVDLAVWRAISNGFQASLPLRKVYFDHETGPILYHLYTIFAAGVPENQLLENVNTFVAFLTVVTASVPLSIIFLGFRLPQDLLSQFMTDKKALMAATPNAPLSAGAAAVNEAQEFVELAQYVAARTSSDSWAKNRSALPWLFGFPEKLKLIGARKWFMKISGSRGKFAHPFKVSWAQLKLILEPTPFLGFFFVDHYVNVGDVKRARTVCAGLPYDMTVSFPAIYRSPEVQVTAAHFVHYLEWDSLQRAYEEFEGDNAANERLMAVVSVVRGVYNAPLASAAHWAALAYVSETEVLEDCIAQLLDGIDTETTPELVVVREICAKWMQFTRKAHGHCRAPKKGHILTLLVVAAWAQNQGNIAGSKNQSKSLIALTGLNEDRALLNALIAIFIVKGLGKHVHILYSTSQGLFRDFTRLSPFLAMLDVASAMNDFTAAADVTFCLQRDMTQFYRDSIFFGHLPFSNTILLVDDMDDLDIDRNPNSIYGKRDEELTTPFKAFFDLFLEHGDDAEQPTSALSGPGAIAWAKAKTAFTQFRDMQENKPNGFSKVGNRYELLDGQGKVSPHKYHFGLEMVRYKLAGDLPSINSKFFYQSLPHIFGQYEGIFGVGSRTPGSDVPENRRFWEKMYGSWSFNVPLDTSQKNVFTKDNAGTISLIDETVVNLKELDLAAAAAKIVPSEAAPSGAAPGTPPPSVSDLGLDSRWQTPPRTPDTRYDPTAASESDAFSTHYSTVGNLPDVVKGQMMNELCDKFFLKFPHNDNHWPSVPQHRKLIEFLDDESMHSPRSIAEFAQSVGLVSRWSSWVSIYDSRRE